MSISSIRASYAATGPQRWVGPGDASRCDRGPSASSCDRQDDRRCDSYDGAVHYKLPPAPWKVVAWPKHAGGPVKARATVAVAAVKASQASADLTLVGRTLDLFV